MKVTVNVECTPEEARTFMGLPDVQPMQEALMAELQQRLSANLQALSPENMMQAWLPASFQGAENLGKNGVEPDAANDGGRCRNDECRFDA